MDALLVVGGAALRRNLGALCVMEVGECTRRHVALLAGLGPSERLEQTPPHNLEPLLSGCRPPRRFDAPDHVAQTVERLPAADAAHLYVVRLRMRRALCV